VTPLGNTYALTRNVMACGARLAGTLERAWRRENSARLARIWRHWRRTTRRWRSIRLPTRVRRARRT